MLITLVFIPVATAEEPGWWTEAEGTVAYAVYSPHAIDRFEFSSLGDKITYSALGPGGQKDIWIADADGSNPVNITGTENIDETLPAWNAQGTKIAYTRNKELWSVNADGSNPVRVCAVGSGVTRVSWTKDGSKILFDGKMASDQASELRYYSIPENKLVRLTVSTNGIGYTYPQWYEDGNNILCTTSNGVSRFTIAGSKLKLLVPKAIAGRLVVNDSILIYSLGAAGNENLWLARADGTEQMQWTREEAGDYFVGVTQAVQDPASPEPGEKGETRIIFQRVNGQEPGYKRLVFAQNPAIELTKPREGGVYGSTVAIDGIATDNYQVDRVEVFVGMDKHLLPIGADGRFQYDLALPEGSHTVTATVYDGIGRTSFAAKTILVDTSPPTFSEMFPAPNAEVKESRPLISIKVNEQGPAGLDTVSARVCVNGQVKAHQWQENNVLQVKLEGDLTTGDQLVEIRVADLVGNMGVQAWSFRINPEVPQPPPVPEPSPQPQPQPVPQPQPQQPQRQPEPQAQPQPEQELQPQPQPQTQSGSKRSGSVSDSSSSSVASDRHLIAEKYANKLLKVFNKNLLKRRIGNVLWADITQHWAKPSIVKLTGLGILPIYPGERFQPDHPLTVAEAEGLLRKLFADEKEKQPQEELLSHPSTIVPKISNMIWREVPVTRIQIIEMIVQAFGDGVIEKEENGGYIRFDDCASLSAKQKSLINIAVQNGWVVGDETGKFRPNEKLTRAEAAVLLERVLHPVLSIIETGI